LYDPKSRWTRLQLSSAQFIQGGTGKKETRQRTGRKVPTFEGELSSVVVLVGTHSARDLHSIAHPLFSRWPTSLDSLPNHPPHRWISRQHKTTGQHVCRLICLLPSVIFFHPEKRPGHLFFFVFDHFTTFNSAPLPLVFPLNKSPLSVRCVLLLLPVRMSSLALTALPLALNLFYRKQGKAGRHGCDSDLSEETEWKTLAVSELRTGKHLNVTLVLFFLQTCKPPHHQVIGCMEIVLGWTDSHPSQNRLIRHGDCGRHRHGLCCNLHGGTYQRTLKRVSVEMPWHDYTLSITMATGLG